VLVSTGLLVHFGFLLSIVQSFSRRVVAYYLTCIDSGSSSAIAIFTGRSPFLYFNRSRCRGSMVEMVAVSVEALSQIRLVEPIERDSH
jgi:hypothetical protein